MEFIHGPPVRQRLARVIHRRFQIDQRLIAQLIDHPEQRLAEIVCEILAFGESAHPQRVAIRCQYRYALANMFGGCAVHDGIESSLQLPCSLARRDHEG